MNGGARASFIGVDMGTTNTRVWRIVDGGIVQRVQARVGIRDSAVAGRPEVLCEVLRRLLQQLDAAGADDLPPPVALVAAGMITSDHGLLEVPHLPAPAGLAELSGAVRVCNMPELCALPVHLVPGVRTGEPLVARERVGQTDVMRGEETLCIGLHAAGILPVGGSLLNLGSHWKVIHLDAAGRVARSATALTGELLHAAQTQTLLSGSVPSERPERLHPDWVEGGLREARTSGLERALFCVRLLEQRAESTPGQRLSYLVGAFIGSALPWFEREIPLNGSVVVAGGGPIAERVGRVLERMGRKARLVDAAEVEEGMARGLALIAAERLRAERRNSPPSR